MTKKLGIYLADDTLAYLSLIQDDGGELSISGAVNLAVQSSKLLALQPISLTAGELLLCCDILNGGAHMTEFKAPDDVSIKAALQSMSFSISDARHYEPELFKKWGVVDTEFASKLNQMDDRELFTIAIATRQFWKDASLGDIKPLSDCDDYQAWAAQWVK